LQYYTTVSDNSDTNNIDFIFLLNLEMGKIQLSAIATKIYKAAPINFAMSVCLFASKNSRNSENIVNTFYIANIYYNL
jgi:hypothetical protein